MENQPINDLASLINFDYQDISFWILQVIAIFITCRLIPRLKVTSFFGPVLTIICLAVINTKIWDAALFFSIPDSLTSQALVLLLTNGVLFWLIVKILPGIEVQGFFPALIAPVVFTLTNLAIDYATENIDWKTVAEYCETAIERTKEYVSENSEVKSTKRPHRTVTQP